MNERSRRLAAVGLLMMAVVVARAQGGMPMHGNHDPHHGGIVLMYGMDLHFEVVVERTGAVRIYFSDGQRTDLPASSVTELGVEIDRPGARSEPVAMTIDATGDYWQGNSASVVIGDATINIAFVFRGDPIVVSVPTPKMLSASQTAREPVVRRAPPSE